MSGNGIQYHKAPNYFKWCPLILSIFSEFSNSEKISNSQNFPGKVKLADNTGYIANQIDCDYPLGLELSFKYIVFNILV